MPENEFVLFIKLYLERVGKNIFKKQEAASSCEPKSEMHALYTSIYQKCLERIRLRGYNMTGTAVYRHIDKKKKYETVIFKPTLYTLYVHIQL